MPNCAHLCPETCHPGQCPSPEKCSKKVINLFLVSEIYELKLCFHACGYRIWFLVHLVFICLSCFRLLFYGKVTVRCGCQTLKKEWLCHDVQAAYRSAGSDPKDISKNQYGHGLIPCNSDCKSKLQVVDSELQLRKAKVSKVISRSLN